MYDIAKRNAKTKSFEDEQAHREYKLEYNFMATQLWFVVWPFTRWHHSFH